MDDAPGPYNTARQQYASLRRSLTEFEERVRTRYRDERGIAHAAFERLLGSMDWVAGWVLADEEIARRGLDLLLTGSTGVPARTAQDEQARAIGAKADQLALEPPPAGAQPAEVVSSGEDSGPGEVGVTFTLPAEVHADSVVLCGEFNGWSTDGIRLERGADGTWQAVVALEPGRSYRYRYLLDGQRWENAWDADHYLPNPYGSVDSVVVVQPPAAG